MLLVLRIFLGVFESAGNPPAYSIIADTFHPKTRGTANSVYSLGIYVGGALASAGTALVNSVGWRWMFYIIAIIGYVSGVALLLLVREPKRGKFEIRNQDAEDEPKKVRPNPFRQFWEALKEVLINPTSRWVTIAATFRFFAGYAIGGFVPKFFGGIYGKELYNLYVLLNTAVVSLCGFASSFVIGGLVSDYYEKRGFYMSKAWVCIIGSLLGVPTMAMCILVQNNFAVSMLGIALEYLTAECWSAPAITMLINTISPQNKGFAVSAYLFCATIGGTISTALLGVLNEEVVMKDAMGNPCFGPDGKAAPCRPEWYGYGLMIFVAFAYIGSVPFFFLAGRNYKAYKEEQDRVAREGMLDG